MDNIDPSTYVQQLRNALEEIDGLATHAAQNLIIESGVAERLAPYEGLCGDGFSWEENGKRHLILGEVVRYAHIFLNEEQLTLARLASSFTDSFEKAPSVAELLDELSDENYALVLEALAAARPSIA